MSDIQDQAAARVEKAKMINGEVLARLHQNDVQPGVAPAPKPKAAPKVKTE